MEGDIVKSDEAKAKPPGTGSSPPAGPSGRQGEVEPHLTVGDWITYLTSEKSGTMGMVLSFGAITIAMVALVYSTDAKSVWISVATGAVVFALMVFLWVKIVKPLGRRGGLAEKLLMDVMSGELKSEGGIRQAWHNGLKSKEKARNTG